MKVLFYSINSSANPLFERELELISNHQDQGDEIYVLGCPGSLESCYSNPENRYTRCVHCKMRFSEGMKILNIPKKNIFMLNNTIVTKNISNSFKNVEELKQFSLHGVDFGLAVASLMVSVLRDHDFDTLKHKELIGKMLRASILVYESVIKVFQVVKPDLVYMFNGRYSDVRPVLRACEQLGINFYTHETADSSVDRYSLFYNSIPHSLEGIHRDIENVWSNGGVDRQEVGERWFIARRNGAEQLGISYTKEQLKGNLPFGFDSTSNNIAIFNSSMDEYEGVPEWGNPVYITENEGLIKILDHFHGRNDINFHLRIHPNLKGLYNAQMRGLRQIANAGYKNLNIIWPEEVVDSYALMLACNKTLTFISTMGAEACFWGKPAILAGRAFYERLECVYKPKTHKEVVSLIDSKLKPKNRSGVIKYGYWLSSNGIPFKKYVPEDLFRGKFMGKEVLHRYSPNKIKFWFFRLLEEMKLVR